MAGRKSKEQLSQLAAALAFVSVTYNLKTDQAQYCLMENHSVRTFNSIIAAGTRIEEDLYACPHAELMLAAILRCGPEYVITQLSPEKLVVRSGDFQAYIPCFDPLALSWPIPDLPTTPIGDGLLTALKKVAILVSTQADTVLECAIQLNAGTCIATDRRVILEAWHGYELPDGMLLPKVAIQALNKVKKPLASFGASPITATFYFNDQSWIKTRLYQDRWPNVQDQFRVPVNPRPVPPYLFSAARKVAPFSLTGAVHVQDEMVSSHRFDVKEEGSSLKLPIGSKHAHRIYDIGSLDIVAKFANLWDEHAHKTGTYFEGEKIRGLLFHQAPALETADDDDIPF